MAHIEEDYLLAFSNQLDRVFKTNALTYQQIIEEAGRGSNISTDRSNIQRIVKGRVKNIRLTTLFKIAKGLKIHPMELLDFEFNGKTPPYVKKEESIE